ncbi:MAG: hypothetical protein DSZ28_03750, partial [Thiothrix sp.]
GQFLNNIIVFDKQLKTAINIGGDTEASSFSFKQNQWYNTDTPQQSKPILPSPESLGVYGENPDLDPDLLTPTKDLSS